MPGPAQPHEKPEIQRYILEGFTGGLHTPGSWSKMQIDDTECTCASNVEFWPVGTIAKRAGMRYKNANTPLSGAVTQIHQWWTEAGANHILCFQAASAATCSAQVLTMTPTSQTTATFAYILSSGQVAWNPGEDHYVSIETFGGSAIFCDGVSPLFTFNGASCSVITTAPTGAVAIRGYKNYLFLANAEDATGRNLSRIWWSDPGDAHTWPAANYLDLDAKDGDLIVGMEILGNELIIFKERKIYAVTYVGGQYEFYAENRVMGVGCGAIGSIIPIFSELVFYGIENMYSFTGRDIESLGDKINSLLVDYIIPEHRYKICGTSVEEREQLWWAVPFMSTIDGNSHILVLDYIRDSWTLFSGRTNALAWYTSVLDLTFGDLIEGYGTYDAMWGERVFLANSDIILAGRHNGFIVERTIGGVTSDLGGDYDGYWVSKWIDFGMPDINKRIVRMTVFINKEVSEESSDYSLYLNIYKDWDSSTIAQTEVLSVYGTSPVLERRLDFTMSCRSLQFKIGSSYKEQPFTIHKIIIEYIPKGRTLVT